MSKKTPIEAALDKVQWRAIPMDDPSFLNDPEALYATHEGTVKFGEAELRCFQLNDGHRVFDADDLARFFAQAEGGSDRG